MRKYYYHDGSDQKGPFTIEELKTEKLVLDTPIWYEGLSEWTKASVVTELESLFKISSPPPFKLNEEKNTSSLPPPFINEGTSENNEEQPSIRNAIEIDSPDSSGSKKYAGVIWTLSIIGVIIIGVVLFIAANPKIGSSIGNTSVESYQEKVMTVEEIEKADPAKFLNASGTYNETFFGDKVKVHGKIENMATVASYKDVVVEIVFYSATDTELKREQYVIYDFFPAHQSKPFELKIAKPKACKKLGWEAVSATPN
ncbi:MAG: DUF4339 domain-containing protein [Bacteroidota bacterium]